MPRSTTPRAVTTHSPSSDLVLAGGRVVDVDRQAVREGWSVAVAGGRIVAVGPQADALRGPGTEVLDVRGQLVTPGLIEPHTHLVRLFIRETARLQVAAGITTTVVETTEIGYPIGAAALPVMLEEARRAPGCVLLTVSPAVGFDPDHERELGDASAWAGFLDDDRVVGVGESYWAELLRGHARSHDLYAAARKRGLAIEGHGAGARRVHLEAMAELGVGSDHEPVTAADVEARLALGMYVYLRHGVTRQDLPALAELWRDRPAPDRVAFCTDGVDPENLVAGRSLNAVVGDAIALGLPVPTAVRMATLVPARRFGLADRGRLAPGAIADVAVFPDESLLAPGLVLSGGQRAEPSPPAALAALRWTPPAFDLDALLEPVPRGRYRAIGIDAAAPMVTREVESDGTGALTLVAVDRLRGRRAFRGLAVGLGLRGCGVATTTGGESAAMLVIGDSPSDMRAAAARVTAMAGGVAVVSGGEVVAAWRAELAGQLSDAPAAEVAAEVAAVNAALRRLGCPMPDPLTTIDFLGSPAIPFLRISPAGYHRLRDGARLPLGLD